MRRNATPILDDRRAAQILSELLTRQPAYVPELTPGEKGPVRALLQIFARYMEAVTTRLNQTPDKNLLAFLDTLGISLISAQAARAPVVFTALPDTGDGRIEARARLGADVPGRSDPVPFETEHAVALAQARLVEVKTVWPVRDEYADHSVELAGGRAVTLFEPPRAVPHELYLAHDSLFAFSGEVTLNVRFELGAAAANSLAITWEFWDGELWQAFAAFDARGGSHDATEGLTRSGIVKLKLACGTPQQTRINGVNAYWIRARLSEALPPDPARVLPTIERIQLRSEMNRGLAFRLLPILQFPVHSQAVVAADAHASVHSALGAAGVHGLLVPDEAFANGLAVDLTNTFYPFGQQPQPGSAFYFTSEEIFGKPGATMFVSIAVVPPHAPDPANGELPLETPVVAWEYWDGAEWTAFVPESTSGDAMRFTGNGLLTVQIPRDMASVPVNDSEHRWIRVRLLRGGYGFKREISYLGPEPNTGPFRFTIVETLPPAIASLRLGYTYVSPWEYPEHCIAFNDFQYEVRDEDVRRAGNLFAPFRPVSDVTPTLYLGLSHALPNDIVRLYFGVREQDAAPSPLVWEAWDGSAWKRLSVADETADLTRAGLVSFVPPDPRTAGRVTASALARFGRPLDWIRARLKDDGAPFKSALDGIHLNATWAIQVQTLENEVLGSGTGEPGESVFFSQAPVLRGEVVEVRELEGARAAVELPMLQEELSRDGLPADALRVASDSRLGRATEVWVRWESRPHLYFSGPNDRHYVIERARGRVIFGDGQNGRIPPISPNNIVAARYHTGGGAAGNVPAGTITQLLGSATIVESVTNPRAADGGAESETIEAVMRRGPQRLRHLGRALSAADYEALAREASPGVAMVRVLAATAANGRPAPGYVTVIVVPQSADPQPQPSFELRREVHEYLEQRMPSGIGSNQLAVIGPTYVPIGVSAGVVPRDIAEAGRVEAAVREALERFLHPLTGGPEEEGWPFGRDVYLSDVAAILESLEGVDFVGELELMLNDIPQGEHVEVPPDRIVVAGPLRIEMRSLQS